MTSELLFDGFYYSGPVEWEEWHAGVRMHGVRFHYCRYYQNGDWLHSYRDQAFDFWAFTESVTPELLALAKRGQAPQVGDADPLCTAGTYTIDNNTVLTVFSPDWAGKRMWESRREIQERRLGAVDSKKASYAFFFEQRPERLKAESR